LSLPLRRCLAPTAHVLGSKFLECLVARKLPSFGGPLLRGTGRGPGGCERQLPAIDLPLADWAQQYLAHYFHLPSSRMHAWLAQRLQTLGPGTRLALIAPRDSAKTTWLSFAYPLYCAVTGWQRYIVLVADTAEQARRYLAAIKRELEQNALLLQRYPTAAGRGTAWKVNRILLRSGVEIEALGTGQNIRGRKNAQTRPTLVVVDDPQDRRKVSSPAQRTADWGWFTQDLLNVGSPDTIYLVAGTSLHREALVDRLLHQPGWEARRFASLEQWPERMSLWHQWEALYTDRQNPDRQPDARAFYEQHRGEMDQGAVACWPQREGLYDLMRLRVDIGRAAFESEKQGNPLNPELCEWPEEYFADHIWFREWPVRLAVKTMALDPSKGRDARVGDYSAFVMLGVSHDATLYVEADIERRPVESIVYAGVEWCRGFQPDAFGCEANAWQDLLRGDFEEAFRQAKLLHARPWPMENHEPKVVRIRRLGPWLSQRRLRFKTASLGTDLLIQQLKDFPVGQHDDGPDALEMAIRLAQELLAGHGDDGLGRTLMR
jgi:hypothetical protein